MRIQLLLAIATAAASGCASIEAPPASTAIADNYVSPNGTCRIQIPSLLNGFSEFFAPDERLLIVGTMECIEGKCRLIDLGHRWGGHRIAMRLTADGAITGGPISLSQNNKLIGSPSITPESCRFTPSRPIVTDPTAGG